MRRLTPALALLLAACATPRDDLAPIPDPAARIHAAHQHGHLIGLTAPELGELFGQSALQVREGPGLKLQWRGGGCVLDAYLYQAPNGQGLERAAHIDTRLTSGASTDPSSCEASLEAAH